MKSLREKYPNSCVYWIYHKELHTNPIDQGYVGVSAHGAEKRFKNHLWYAARGSYLKVHKAIREFGDSIACKVLVLGSPEYCLEVEAALRPVADMAGTWNMGAGGGCPGVGRVMSDAARLKISRAATGRRASADTKSRMAASQAGRKHSEATKKKIGEGNRTPHTQETRDKMSASWNRGRDWEHPRANAATWAKAIEMLGVITAHPDYGCDRLKASVGLRQDTSALVKKIHAGWNPNNDPAYLSWLASYNNSKELASEEK